jgi:hypothetical protein
MNEIGGVEWMDGWSVRLIICKAYSGVSSEAVGPNDGSIWSCIRGCVRISVEALRTRQMTEDNRSPNGRHAGCHPNEESTIII